MMTGKLFINGCDAWSTWRVFLEDGSIDKLLLPAAIKPYIENKSRTMHGKHVLVREPKLEDRDITLVFCFATNNPEQFGHIYWGVDDFSNRLKSFMDTIMGIGKDFTGYSVEIGIGDLNTFFYLTYVSSLEISSLNNKIGKIAVRLNEPDPTNRPIIQQD